MPNPTPPISYTASLVAIIRCRVPRDGEPPPVAYDDADAASGPSSRGSASECSAGSLQPAASDYGLEPDHGHERSCVAADWYGLLLFANSTWQDAGPFG